MRGIRGTSNSDMMAKIIQGKIRIRVIEAKTACDADLMLTPAHIPTQPRVQRSTANMKRLARYDASQRSPSGWFRILFRLKQRASQRRSQTSMAATGRAN